MISYYRFHEAPTHIAFTQPVNKLIAKVPHYADSDLLAGMADNGNSGSEAIAEGSDVSKDGVVSMPVSNADQWQKICASGIARVADLQRAQAVICASQSTQSTVAQPHATDIAPPVPNLVDTAASDAPR
jgi:hypothetical protein